MVDQIAEFEYITVSSEMEALILECNLIKKHRPKYNVLLRDDKTYPYIKVTGEEWPRIVKTRLVKKDGGIYFGPYSDAGAVNMIVDLLNSTFALKRCSALAFAKGFRPCLNYHIGQCRGICTGLASVEDYSRALEGAIEFLKGHDRALTDALKKKMMEASDAMEYEKAAEYRDYLEAAKALSETQRVVLHHSSEADIVVPVEPTRQGADSFAVFSVRENRLVGREHYCVDTTSSIDEEGDAVLAAFLNQHYSDNPNIPKEILVSEMPRDGELLGRVLSDNAGHSVKIIKPERGEKRALLELAIKDAAELAVTIDARAKAERQRREALGEEIWSVLTSMGMVQGSYDGREFRAEAYDISNTNGVDTVGAMVVYKGLKPDRSSYRKFRIRTVPGQDDYASMREVLSRRFLRVFKGDEKFAVLPDIIFMDGGKGHVTTALQVIEATGFDIPVVGMAKDDHHRTRALVYRAKAPDGSESWEEIELAGRNLLFKYVGMMQEEAHRFAIEYHRKLRSKNVEKSVLDRVKGIGPKRRRALLETFGSVEEIRRIAREEPDAERVFAETESMDLPSAQKLIEFFRL